MRKKSLVIVFLPLATLCIANNSLARLNILTGGITIGYDYDETQYEKDDIEEGSTPGTNRYLKQMSIGPRLIFETSSSLDALSLSFNPSFVYDFEESSNDLDHNFALSAHRDFTQRLRIDLTDSFIYSTDPELLEAENSTDYNRGRRRYWTNNFNISSSYSYTEDNSFGAGYSYQILRNDDTGSGGYEDYDRHVADLSLQHSINASWNFGINTSFTRGLFDPPDPEIVNIVEEEFESISPGITDSIDTSNLSNDLAEYRASANVNWILSPRKTAFMSYSFSGSDYDAALRFDTNVHNLTFGGQYMHTQRLSFEAGVGPSYEKTETYDPNWGYNAHVSANYDLAEHSSVGISGTKGYDQENFSSNNNGLGRDQGLTEFWDWQVDLSHDINNDIALTLFGSYRDEHQENILHGIIATIEASGDLENTDRETFREESVFNRKIYTAGGSLSYTFFDWYTAAFNYTFRSQDSERINDSYDEHRIYVTLSFQKELLRW